ncbi:MAG: redox-sensing transcriptional repressor Rex [Anaerolineales bacterium]|nr:redox-sensing transcriptional repressor Rex [Anaerolineales bacterium]MDW8446800.1 redox-sensing transcriptional repressor Rex [Anaerolineales bacterium]
MKKHKANFYDRIYQKFISEERENMSSRTVPDIVIGRLPQYLRTLQRMADENRIITSSQELAERLGISAAQIRKDLSLFGEFGKQGTGYDIHFLIEKLRSILKVDRVWDIVVVGVGDIGSAIARYQGFTNRGFRVAMLFDKDPVKIGTQVGNFIVQDSRNLVEAVQRAGIKIGMITVPSSEAQSVAEQLIKGGVRAILNYAPISLNVPPYVRVQYIDPVIHLQRMTYYLD